MQLREEKKVEEEKDTFDENRYRMASNKLCMFGGEDKQIKNRNYLETIQSNQNK